MQSNLEEIKKCFTDIENMFTPMNHYGSEQGFYIEQKMLLKLKKNMKEMAFYFESLGGKGTAMSSQEQPRPGFTEYS